VKCSGCGHVSAIHSTNQCGTEGQKCIIQCIILMAGATPEEVNKQLCNTSSKLSESPAVHEDLVSLLLSAVAKIAFKQASGRFKSAVRTGCEVESVSQDIFAVDPHNTAESWQIAQHLVSLAPHAQIQSVISFWLKPEGLQCLPRYRCTGIAEVSKEPASSTVHPLNHSCVERRVPHHFMRKAGFCFFCVPRCVAQRALPCLC
jgi:hypothetical protein